MPAGPGPGHPAHPSPRRIPSRSALTARLPRELPPRPPRTERRARPGGPSHLPAPRVRAVTAVAAAALESEGRGPRSRAPAVSASPALPQAARGGAERQEAAPLKPVSAAPDQTARPPRGAGPEGRWGGT